MTTQPIPGGDLNWKFLADAGELLDGSLDYQATLSNVLRLAVPAIADFAAIALRSGDGSMSWGSSVHRNPAKAEIAARLMEFQPSFSNPANPGTESLRLGKPVCLNRTDDRFLESIAHNETHLALLKELAFTSLVFVPLNARERALGILIFGATSDSGRCYGNTDVTLAQEIGRRAALAVDNAILYRTAEESARAREVMMGVVSHDLKNPLSTISMAASFLLEELIPDDDAHAKQRAQLGVVQRNAERMFRLIHDLLDVTAIEAGHISLGRRRVQPIQPLLDDVSDMLAPLAAASQIQFTTDVADGLPMVDVDRDRLLQVFSNLGGNAIKFTPAGGKVGVAARLVGDAIEFTVSDNGPGIAEADRARVFESFWQAKNTAHLGTGLGLAIAKGIVEAHGGQIQLSSTVGVGTDFIFTIPVGAVPSS